MDRELARFLHRITFILVAISSAATEIAADDLRPVLTSLGLSFVWLAVAILVMLLIRPPSRADESPPRWPFAIFLAVAVLPMVIEPYRQQWTGSGYPLELQMVAGFRNMVLGFAVCGAWRYYLRLATGSSLFLMLFAMIMSDHIAILPLLGLYCAVGSLWLTAMYWSGLKHYFVTAENAVIVEATGGKQARLPGYVLVTLVLLGMGLSAFAVIGPKKVLGTLGEWMPTSGGTGGYDPFARSGVGDGQDETKGNNPKSTGMLNSDTFLDTPLPSLYDLVNDMYGEPFKSKDQERMIALDQTKLNVIEAEKRPADNLRPNREFSASRSAPRKQRDMADRSARAMYEVSGRTPLHLRVTAYDAFVGNTWIEAPVNSRNVRIEKSPDSLWMDIHARELPNEYAPVERHEIKLTAPEGNLIPTPPTLQRFKLGRVDQESFFGWGQDRILRFADRTTPAGITIETDSRCVKPTQLPDTAFSSLNASERLRYHEVPAQLLPRLTELAKSWTADLPRGWPQIEAILSRLTHEYQLEAIATDPVDPVGTFLFETKRGPDYLFATSAALLLRTLGYSTRMVNGFYAAPDAYDSITKHTPVVREDMHCWTEVMLNCGEWLVIEPSPGYETLMPTVPFSERVWSLLQQVYGAMKSHPLLVGSLFAVVIASWVLRRRARDVIAVWRLRFIPTADWHQRVLYTSTLIERRGEWSGYRRPLSQSRADWLRGTLPADAAVNQFSQMLEWGQYGGQLPQPWTLSEVKAACDAMVREWSMRRFQGINA